MTFSRGVSFLPIILAIALGGIIAGAIYYTFSGLQPGSSPPPPPPPVVLPPTLPRESMWETYTSDKFGIEFKYPRNYLLEEKEVSSSVGTHTALILTADTEENRLLREGKLVGRGGPTSITVDIYSNSTDNLTLTQWIKTRSDSNYRFSDGILTNFLIDEREAVYYHWDGLYKADTATVRSGGYIFAVTGTYVNPDDQIRRDYSQVLTFIKFKSTRDTIVRESAMCGVPGPACSAPAIPDCQDGKWVCMGPASGE
ncbi:MAG TPA: hypothetical protein VJB56_01510 [Candidatus Paceibacterota bacterium]